MTSPTAPMRYQTRIAAARGERHRQAERDDGDEGEDTGIGVDLAEVVAPDVLGEADRPAPEEVRHEEQGELREPQLA